MNDRLTICLDLAAIVPDPHATELGAPLSGATTFVQRLSRRARVVLIFPRHSTRPTDVLKRCDVVRDWAAAHGLHVDSVAARSEVYVGPFAIPIKASERLSYERSLPAIHQATRVRDD